MSKISLVNNENKAPLKEELSLKIVESDQTEASNACKNGCCLIEWKPQKQSDSRILTLSENALSERKAA